MRKIYFILFATIIILASCGQEKDVKVKNQDFVNSFEKTNNALLKAGNAKIKGDLSAKLSAGLEYELSKIEVGILSNNSENVAYYNLELSPNTIISLVQDYTDTGDNINVLKLLPTYTKKDSKDLIKGGNKTGKYLSYDASTLNNLYAANKSYLAIQENKVRFGENLESYNVSTTVASVNNKNTFVTTMSLTNYDILKVIPFIEVDDNVNDANITIKAYHQELGGLIERIEVELVDYTIMTQNNLVFANANIVLSFDLPVGGENDETK